MFPQCNENLGLSDFFDSSGFIHTDSPYYVTEGLGYYDHLGVPSHAPLDFIHIDRAAQPLDILQTCVLSPVSLGLQHSEDTSLPQTIAPSQMTLKKKPLDSIPSLVDSLYPPGREECLPYRERLTHLLRSSCIQDRTKEDAHHTKNFFIKRNRGYRCSVWGCSHVAKRLDRATNHFRTHIDHRPYVCTGCDKGKCGERFYAKETLKAHEKRKRTSCEHCGSPLETKNLKRHLTQNRACKESRKMRG